MIKRREIIISAKSQPPFGVHRQYLDVSLIDFPDRFTGKSFEILLSNFSPFCWFFKNLTPLSSVLFLKSSRLMIFLHLETFKNKPFELDFSIFQKSCFYGQTSLGR